MGLVGDQERLRAHYHRKRVQAEWGPGPTCRCELHLKGLWVATLDPLSVTVFVNEQQSLENGSCSLPKLPRLMPNCPHRRHRRCQLKELVLRPWLQSHLGRAKSLLPARRSNSQRVLFFTFRGQMAAAARWPRSTSFRPHMLAEPCERRPALSSSVLIASPAPLFARLRLGRRGSSIGYLALHQLLVWRGALLLGLGLSFFGAALATEGSVMGAALAVMGSSACVATQARAGRLPCACSFGSPGVATETLETLFSWRDAASTSLALRLHR